MSTNTTQGGVISTSKNVLNTKAAATPLTSTVTRLNGRAHDASGNLCTVDATAGLPASVVRVGGIAYTPDGRMCTTTAVPALTAARISGMAVRNDGAVHIVTGALTSPTRSAGRAFDAFGRLSVISN